MTIMKKIMKKEDEDSEFSLNKKERILPKYSFMHSF